MFIFFFFLHFTACKPCILHKTHIRLKVSSMGRSVTSEKLLSDMLVFIWKGLLLSVEDISEVMPCLRSGIHLTTRSEQKHYRRYSPEHQSC